jgi:hypothetical protein
MEAPEREIAERDGFEIHAPVHEMLGRCSDCRKKGVPVERKGARPADGARRPRRVSSDTGKISAYL